MTESVVSDEPFETILRAIVNSAWVTGLTWNDTAAVARDVLFDLEWAGLEVIPLQRVLDKLHEDGHDEAIKSVQSVLCRGDDGKPERERFSAI